MAQNDLVLQCLVICSAGLRGFSSEPWDLRRKSSDRAMVGCPVNGECTLLGRGRQPGTNTAGLRLGKGENPQNC